MKLALVLLLALALTAAAPAAVADPLIPPEKLPQCDDIIGEPKCGEVRDLFICTCPLL